MALSAVVITIIEGLSDDITSKVRCPVGDPNLENQLQRVLNTHPRDRPSS